MASAPASAADTPGVLGLDEVLRQVAQDDQEEWEYEYSATETETYYLTLELSYPEFKERAAPVPQHSRGGYYKNWMDRSKSRAAVARANSDGRGHDAQSDDDDDDDAGDGGDVGDGGDEGDEGEEGDDDVDDDAPPLDPELLAAGKHMERERRAAEKQRETAQEQEPVEDEEEYEAEALEDIQILDLHSDRPIISYRGRVFEGQWAEVIGTEAILARHDDERPLPALRNLADKVDVLAASSSRIMTTEKVLKPRLREEDTLAPIKEEWNIRIPRGKDRTGERGLQADFLEKMIALKMKKGQSDQVTIYAADGAGKDWDDRHEPDYKQRTVRKRAEPADDEGSGLGSGEGEKDESASGSGSGGGHAPRRKRGRSRVSRRVGGGGVGGRVGGRAGGRAGARGRWSAGGVTRGSRVGRGQLSVTTPGHWEELSRQGAGDGDDVCGDETEETAEEEDGGLDA